MRLKCSVAGTVLVLVAVAVAAIGLARPAQADDEVLPAYAPLRAVAVMLETGQALFWDERANEYRLGKVGEEIYGWKLVAVEAGRAVIAQAGVREELPLLAPPKSMVTWQPPEPSKPAAPVPAPRQLPTVDVVSDEPAPAPAAPAVPAAPPAAPAATPRPAPPAPPAPAAAPPVTEESYQIPRRELDREINDFGHWKHMVQVKAAAGGGFVLARLPAECWLAKIGFREGDIVRAVAGERVSSVDDAARVYARLRSIRVFSVEIDRGPRRVVLRYQVLS